MASNEEGSVKPDETLEDHRADLVKLQRQFRILEDDRRAYKEEAENTLNRQQHTIDVLTREYEELETDIKLAGSNKNKTFDSNITDKLGELLKQESQVLVDIRDEEAAGRLVNKQIKSLRALTDALRKNMGGSLESEKICIMTQKLNRVTENRFNQANIKFGTLLADNFHMREQIGNISIQRSRFEDLRKKLTRVFTNNCEAKEILIDQATALFTSRDEAVNRMQSLRERNERDLTQYNAELKDLLRIIDHDRELQKFMTTKTEERGEMYEAVLQARQDKKFLDQCKSLSVEVEAYEKIFDELRVVSGSVDIDDMVRAFIEVEDQNFAAFNLIKDQSVRIQQLEVAIEHYRTEIATLGRDEKHLSSQHKSIVKELEGKQEAILDKIKEANETWKVEKKLLDKLMPAIDGLVDEIKCDRTQITELLGGAEISAENAVRYLGLVEQKANEMLQAKALMTSKRTAADHQDSTPLFSFALVSKIARAFVPAPAICSDDESSISMRGNCDSTRPFTREDARVAASTSPYLEGNPKKNVKQFLGNREQANSKQSQ